MAKKKNKNSALEGEQSLSFDFDPFVQPKVEEKKEEFPVFPIKKEVPLVISKIVKCRDREIYVVRVYSIAFKALKLPARFIYSAWEIPKSGSTYNNYTTINNILLAKIDSEYVKDVDNGFYYSQDLRVLAYEAIEIASPEAGKFGSKRHGFVYLTIKDS